MENMRHMLSAFNASTPLHLGFKYKNPAVSQGFMSGGSGYILTKEAIRLFVEIALNKEDTNKLEINQTYQHTKSACTPGQEGPEDLNLGDSLIQ